MLFCAWSSFSCLRVEVLWTSIKTNGSWFVKFWQIQNWRSMTRQSESCPNFLWGVHFREIFLLPYASSPAILGDLIGSRVSESCDCSASEVFHSRTKNLRSGRLIPRDLLVIRDHWCQKKREPIATANSVKSILESSWFLKKVDFGHERTIHEFFSNDWNVKKHANMPWKAPNFWTGRKLCNRNFLAVETFSHVCIVYCMEVN